MFQSPVVNSTSPSGNIKDTAELYRLIFKSSRQFFPTTSGIKCILDDHHGKQFKHESCTKDLTTETTFVVVNPHNENISELYRQLQYNLFESLLKENKWNSKNKINTPLIVEMMKAGKDFNAKLDRSISNENGVYIRIIIKISAYNRKYT